MGNYGGWTHQFWRSDALKPRDDENKNSVYFDVTAYEPQGGSKQAPPSPHSNSVICPFLFDKHYLWLSLTKEQSPWFHPVWKLLSGRLNMMTVPPHQLGDAAPMCEVVFPLESSHVVEHFSYEEEWYAEKFWHISRCFLARHWAWPGLYGGNALNGFCGWEWSYKVLYKLIVQQLLSLVVI